MYLFFCFSDGSHPFSELYCVVFIRCITFCHVLLLIVICFHSLSYIVTHCHSLSLVVPPVVTCRHLLYHLLSFFVTLVVTRRHSLLFVVTRCATRRHLFLLRCTICLSFYKRSFFEIILQEQEIGSTPNYKLKIKQYKRQSTLISKNELSYVGPTY